MGEALCLRSGGTGRIGHVACLTSSVDWKGEGCWEVAASPNSASGVASCRPSREILSGLSLLIEQTPSTVKAGPDAAHAWRDTTRGTQDRGARFDGGRAYGIMKGIDRQP